MKSRFSKFNSFFINLSKNLERYGFFSSWVRFYETCLHLPYLPYQDSFFTNFPYKIFYKKGRIWTFFNVNLFKRAVYGLFFNVAIFSLRLDCKLLVDKVTQTLFSPSFSLLHKKMRAPSTSLIKAKPQTP